MKKITGLPLSMKVYFGYPFCSIVEFRHKDDAEKAIKELHGTEFKGRSIHIREVKLGVHRVLRV